MGVGSEIINYHYAASFPLCLDITITYHWHTIPTSIIIMIVRLQNTGGLTTNDHYTHLIKHLNTRAMRASLSEPYLELRPPSVQ